MERNTGGYMEDSELIYLLDDDDVIPVKAEEVVCFWNEPIMHEDRIWMSIDLKDGTLLQSDRYGCSETDNILRTLLTKKDFVLIEQPGSNIFLDPGHIRLCGVRFSAIMKIGKYMDYVEYESDHNHRIPGKIVESTVKNYKKWKESQEDI
jgi:hypothetical protein